MPLLTKAEAHNVLPIAHNVLVLNAQSSILIQRSRTNFVKVKISMVDDVLSIIVYKFTRENRKATIGEQHHYQCLMDFIKAYQ